MRICIEISDYQCTCSKIVVRTCKIRENTSCELRLLLHSRIKSIEPRWQNKLFNENLDSNLRKKKTSNFFLSFIKRTRLLPDETSILVFTGDMHRCESNESSNICLKRCIFVRTQWEIDDFFIYSIHHVVFSLV